MIKNNGHPSTSYTTADYEMSNAMEEHPMEVQTLPEKVETFLENNEQEIEQRNLENQMQISSTFYSDPLVYPFLENDATNSTDFSSYEYLGKTFDVYLSVLEINLNTWRLSDKDKFWITESALCAIPFGNTDIRKWTADDVVLYLDKFVLLSSPINYYNYSYPKKQTFENFKTKDINGEAFLALSLTDLLATVKPPKRRQILMIYGAILILKKYIAVYYTKLIETYESECTGFENSFIDDIVPADLCLNSDIYFSVLEAELKILKLSTKDAFWITESVVSSMPMFGTIDVRKWSVKEVIVYLKQLVKVSSPINYTNYNDAEQANMFGKFINEDINGAAFLMLTQRDLLNLIKPPSRRLNTPKFRFDACLSVRFVTRLIKQLEADYDADLVFIRNSRNDFRTVAVYDYKPNKFNIDQQTHEKLKQDVQRMLGERNKIEHHFNIVDRQLQFAMKKKMFVQMKSEAIIIAAMKEHEHKILNLKLESKKIVTKIESNAKINEIEKNNLTLIRNDLTAKKARIVQTYDTKMMEKHKNVNDFNSKIKTIEANIDQLQELISCQMPFYSEVILEQEMENERIWNEKLHVIQRNIAARKIQIRFRSYLNYIKTRDAKKTKKGQHKKQPTKTKKN
ncbi:Sterile alpha motif/pointed domain [Cinara cedri]|uniref:Sterile alpha motif/pointed domain n=1 Tax=Cinara cedri TaxID=506608 RepID=A0A5E4NK94_9HEMI|nr:Sterile alpha motif/pointed domain [Cinara cedri]